MWLGIHEPKPWGALCIAPWSWILPISFTCTRGPFMLALFSTSSFLLLADSFLVFVWDDGNDQKRTFTSSCLNIDYYSICIHNLAFLPWQWGNCPELYLRSAPPLRHWIPSPLTSPRMVFLQRHWREAPFSPPLQATVPFFDSFYRDIAYKTCLCLLLILPHFPHSLEYSPIVFSPYLAKKSLSPRSQGLLLPPLCCFFSGSQAHLIQRSPSLSGITFFTWLLKHRTVLLLSSQNFFWVLFSPNYKLWKAPGFRPQVPSTFNPQFCNSGKL